jgi:hypothetical protein
MTAKSLLIVGALGLASLGIANAKSYDIILSSTSKVGNMELKPGEYKLKVDGSQAIFTDVESSKTYTAPVKIDNNGKKFDQTTVETTKQGDMDNVVAIDLAGSNTKLQFGE